MSQNRGFVSDYEFVDTNLTGHPNPAEEGSSRLEALDSYGILDTPPEGEYDEIATILAAACETPIAVVSFLTDTRQWFKAEIGMGRRETPLEISFCQHAIKEPGLFVIPDTKEDPRFVNNPLVIDAPHARFYAGAVLKTPQGLPIGTLCVLDNKPRQLSRREGDLLQELAGRVMQKLELRRQGKRSWHEKQLLATIEGALDCIIFINADGQIIEFNPAAEKTFGYRRKDVLGRLAVDKLVPPDWRERFEHMLRRYSLKTDEKPPDKRGEFPAMRADGRQIMMEVSFTAARSAGYPVFIGFLRDITRVRQAEQIQSRYSRALHMLSACNDSLLRIRKEQSLLYRIYQHAVEIGGYRMAWIGYAQNDDDRTVKPMAHAGHENGYLSLKGISWSPNVPEGKGVAGRAIREGIPATASDFEQDPNLAVWRNAARERDYRSVICLPLHGGGKSFGLLGLYSSETHRVEEAELKLLNELAENLASGIMTIRARDEQTQVQKAVLAIAQSISSSGGDDFFEHLTQGMVEALKADAGFIALYDSPQNTQASCLAAWVDGQGVPAFSYDTAHTPCQYVKENRTSIIHRGLNTRFPRVGLLLEWQMEAYVGISLLDSDDVPIGIMAVLFHNQLEKVGFITSTLQIFATRVSSEISRRHTDLRIREQASMLDNARDAIIVRDHKHRITYWNKSAELLYGWKAEEVTGWLAPEVLFRNPDRFYKAMDQLLLHGEWTGEFEQVNKEGRALTVDSRWTLMRDEKGLLKSVLAINTDISEKKKLEAQFLRTQRVESIGTLASGIAHDLNNVLSPILMSVDLLTEKLTDPATLATLATLKSSAQHGAELVKQVVSFARGVEGQRVPVDPNQLVRDVHKIMADTFPRDIKFSLSPACALWSVTGDPTQLYQVLLNLCVNARDAMPDGGTLSLTVENVLLDQFYADRHPDSEAGAYVVWKVSDTGSGMPPEIWDKIFDPFFTTKEVGKGTGLGLSTSLTIVRSHHGFINFSSEKGNGTTFEIFLPAGAPIERNPDDPPHFPSVVNGEDRLVLIVEDEERLRVITGQILERFGYRVLLAVDGAEAIDIYERRREAISLVIVDMVMPVMDGPATIRALRALNPDVAIVASSAWAFSGKALRKKDTRLNHFIAKPYTVEKLLATMTRALAEAEA
jgi:PAS domain S-box-containing protein